jgi:hypothetical protein
VSDMIVLANYAMIKAMTELIWPISHVTSNMITYSVKGLLEKLLYLSFEFFFSQLSHIKLKVICPRGNNKVVIILFHVYDKCLFLMLELY